MLLLGTLRTQAQAAPSEALFGPDAPERTLTLSNLDGEEARALALDLLEELAQLRHELRARR